MKQVAVVIKVALPNCTSTTRLGLTGCHSAERFVSNTSAHLAFCVWLPGYSLNPQVINLCQQVCRISQVDPKRCRQ